MTLDESLEKASADLPTETEIGTEQQETSKESPKETSETKETPVGEKKTEDKVKEMKVSEAMKLQEQLDDPDLGPAMLAKIAKKFNLSLSAETKKEAAQTTKKFSERLRDKLPEESKFLADSIGDAFGELLEEEIESRVTPIKSRVNEDIKTRVERETNGQITKFFESNKINEETQKEMDKISRKFPPGPDVDVEEYLSNLHKIATYGKSSGEKLKQTVDKINKNQREEKPSPTEVNESRVRKGSKLPSLDEAISNAVETTMGGKK